MRDSLHFPNFALRPGKTGRGNFFRKPLARNLDSCILAIAVAHGVLAQLVRAPACHVGGRGFESRTSRQSIIKRFAKWRTFFLFVAPFLRTAQDSRGTMTLRGELTAQLPLRARLTYEVCLAVPLAASALVNFPLADVLAHILASSTSFRAFVRNRFAFRTDGAAYGPNSHCCLVRGVSNLER